MQCGCTGRALGVVVGGRKQLLDLVNEQLAACMQHRDREEREREGL